MTSIAKKTIGEIVTDDITSASVFKKYNIDFCCGGGKTLEGVCLENNISIAKVVSDLETTGVRKIPSVNFNDWDISFLIDYIVNVHHNYVRNTIGTIQEFAKKVATVHGEHAPETVKIYELFEELAVDLVGHLENEEKLLFPYLKGTASSSFDSKKKVIEMLEGEHDQAGTIIKEIQSLSNNFQAPEWGCNTFKALYNLLDEFINDLYQHIHLENNILFQKIK